ncbi:MAG TPA: FHA domain-containing protein, partial [Pyrinomonadaceae bacterium]|nr:FHA domain-containing protein [Pyrinomonadaceae bacterium]
EEFIVKIARAVEAVMQKEMLPLPQGTAIIPTEYTIFLSDGDDKEWQGVKRRGLEQGLYHILAERAREIAGKKKLETKSFVIELRIDGTLEKGEVRVQHSWEESSSNKTGVLARPKPKTPANQQPAKAPVEAAKPSGSLASGRPYSPPTNVQPPNFTSQVSPRQMTQQAQAAQPPPQKAPVVSDEAEIMTSVRPRVSELFKLEIWQRGVRQNVIPIFNMETTVGRGSKSKPVDIALTGDPEISRRHVKIITDGGGNYWVVNEGRNPAMIANYELPEGQRVPFVPGTSLAVGSYVLRIQA